MTRASTLPIANRPADPRLFDRTGRLLDRGDREPRARTIQVDASLAVKLAADTKRSTSRAARVAGPGTTTMQAARLVAGLTRKAMAEALGWSEYRVDRFERGDRHAHAAEVEAWNAAISEAASK